MSSNVAALILAAGFSSRMGAFKPLLQLGGMTTLERAVSLFRSSGVEDVRVVTGYRSEELEPLLKHLCVRNILNTDFQNGMFSSVTAGVKTIESGLNAFFILPVDIPLIRPHTIHRLLESYEQGRDEALYPRFQGVRGHPPLIAARRAGSIASWSGVDGLQGALAQWESCAREIDVADEHILNDMDTPEAYGSLMEKVQQHQVPTEGECMALLEIFCKADSPIISHGRAVADLAALFAEKLNQTGYRLDIRLLTAAGLLHDLARAESNHARTGARLLRAAGFGAVADLVADHMDLTPTDEEEISPAELLYLADKLVQGESRVPLAERFQGALERHHQDPVIYKKIIGRLQAALIIQTRLEATLGCSITEVITTP
jgi:CTP:molybdopterin cytidylyltransferase MocA